MTGDSPFTRYGKWLALPRGMLDAGDIRARLDYEAEALAVRFLGHRRRFLRRGGALYWGWSSARVCRRDDGSLRTGYECPRL